MNIIQYQAHFEMFFLKRKKRIRKGGEEFGLSILVFNCVIVKVFLPHIITCLVTQHSRTTPIFESKISYFYCQKRYIQCRQSQFALVEK